MRPSRSGRPIGSRTLSVKISTASTIAQITGTMGETTAETTAEMTDGTTDGTTTDKAITAGKTIAKAEATGPTIEVPPARTPQPRTPRPRVAARTASRRRRKGLSCTNVLTSTSESMCMFTSTGAATVTAR